MTISQEILTQFTDWMESAKAHEAIRDYDAVNLATSDATGRLSSRIVLLREFDARGFVFFTNYNGRKSLDLAVHSKAAMNLYWEPLMRQIRIEGVVEKVDAAQSDAYFASRSRGSQIGAWASNQSEKMTDRAELEGRLKEYEQKFDGEDVPRPPHWGGWRLVPDMVEFWQEGDFRLHQRDVWQLKGDKWNKMLLNP